MQRAKVDSSAAFQVKRTLAYFPASSGAAAVASAAPGSGIESAKLMALQG